MAQHIVLLRGINLGSRNRIAMPALRTALEAAGFADVRTYVQSGNVVLSSSATAADLKRKVQRVIAKEFGLDIAIVTRTRAQLAKVVERNPLATVAKNPKRYQVSFLDAKPSQEVVRRIEEAADPKERVVVDGREIYAWHRTRSPGPGYGHCLPVRTSASLRRRGTGQRLRSCWSSLLLQRPVERVVGDLLPAVQAGHEVRAPHVLLELRPRRGLALELVDPPVQRDRTDVVLAPAIISRGARRELAQSTPAAALESTASKNALLVPGM